MRLRYAIYILFVLFTLQACGEKKKPNPVVIKMSDFEDPMIKRNKELSKQEQMQIDAYVKRHKYNMIETGTGVRYMIYEKGSGESANTKDIVVMDFDIQLLDGTLCYTSKSTGAEQFVVDYDNVESGLHEAIKFLHKGDKAIIIIPSHRAFGLVGDADKIPPLSTVVYN